MAVKYKWIAERLEAAAGKNMQNGIHKLPTEQELCAKYLVSRQTIRMALGLLEEKGIITRKQGSGSYFTGRSATPQKDAIGILISSDQEYIYPDVLHDIESKLSENGFSSSIFPTGNQISREREILLKLLKNPLRGIIVEGCKSAFPNPNIDLYRKLVKKGCLLVFLYNYYPNFSDCICIKDNNEDGSAMLVQYLAGQGHTAIGGIFKYDDMQGIERYQGFMEAMRDLGLPLSDSHVCWYGTPELDMLTENKDTRFLRKMAEESLSSCTAVICHNDLIAYYLADELLLAGCQLPEDMAIAAFDNSYFSSSGIPTVTTLSHQPHEMGTKAADAIIKKLSGLPVPSQETRWNLTIKESTQPNRR